MKSSTQTCFAMLLTCLQAACVATSQSLTPASLDRPSETILESERCPSQDFPTFLKRFSDAQDGSVRAKFTADPVAYEVLFYTVAEPDESSPEMFVSEEKGVSRLRLFPYRYFSAADDYDRVDGNDEPFALPAVQARNKYPLRIVKMSGDRRRVVFGMEHEVDVFEFHRAEGCWHLTRIINPRD